jgi:hypothetical protein
LRAEPYSLRNFISRQGAKLTRPPDGADWRSVYALVLGLAAIGGGVWALWSPDAGIYDDVMISGIPTLGVALILMCLSETVRKVPQAVTTALRTVSAVLLVLAPTVVLAWTVSRHGLFSEPVVTMSGYYVGALVALDVLLGNHRTRRKSGFLVQDESRPAPVRRSDGAPRPDRIHGPGAR